MTSPYKQFGTDKSLEAQKGVELEYDGFSITVLRAGGENRAYLKALEERGRQYRRKGSKKLEADVLRKAMAEVYADSVIIGWKDVKDADDNPIPFSKENCVKLLTDLPDLFTDIITACDDMKTFRKEQIEEDRKN